MSALDQSNHDVSLHLVCVVLHREETEAGITVIHISSLSHTHQRQCGQIPAGDSPGREGALCRLSRGLCGQQTSCCWLHVSHFTGALSHTITLQCHLLLFPNCSSSQQFSLFDEADVKILGVYFSRAFPFSATLYFHSTTWEANIILFTPLHSYDNSDYLLLYRLHAASEPNTYIYIIYFYIHNTVSSSQTFNVSTSGDTWFQLDRRVI